MFCDVRTAAGLGACLLVTLADHWYTRCRGLICDGDFSASSREASDFSYLISVGVAGAALSEAKEAPGFRANALQPWLPQNKTLTKKHQVAEVRQTWSLTA